MDQSAFGPLVELKPTIIIFLSFSSQLYFSVEISFHLVDDHSGDAFLVDDFASSPLELGDLFGLVWEVILFFPPVIVIFGLGWIKKAKYIIRSRQRLLMSFFFRVIDSGGCLESVWGDCFRNDEFLALKGDLLAQI